MKERKIIILKYGLGGSLFFGLSVGTVVEYYPEYEILAFVLGIILSYGPLYFFYGNLERIHQNNR